MKEWITLFNDICSNGLKNPLDMYRIGKEKLVLWRGWRRFIIMYVLHKKGIRNFSHIPCRTFKTKEAAEKYAPNVKKWYHGPLEGDSIDALGAKQFAEKGRLATDKWWVHGYTRHYDLHFTPLRDKKIKLLEIGVFRGASLLLWKDVFPNGLIYGLDKNTRIWENNLKGQERIKVFTGHQEDTKFLEEQVVPSGPYDIIIDDGGHHPKEQVASFKALWPHVSSGGFYVIEDLHGNFWRTRAKGDALMVKKIQDIIAEIIGTNECMEYRSVHCYYNICFIEKI